jgi:hypothetical protein
MEVGELVGFGGGEGGRDEVDEGEEDIVGGGKAG